MGQASQEILCLCRTFASPRFDGWQLQIAIALYRFGLREGRLWPRGFLPWGLYDAHPSRVIVASLARLHGRASYNP